MTGVADMCQVQQSVRKHCHELKLSAGIEAACTDHAMHILRISGPDKAIKEGKEMANRIAKNRARDTPHKYRPAAPMSA